MKGFGLTGRFLTAQAAAACLGLYAALYLGAGLLPGFAAALLVLLFGLLDYLFTGGKSRFAAERTLPDSFEQHGQAQIELVLRRRGKGPAPRSLRIADSPPPSFIGGGGAAECAMAGGIARYVYTVTPASRGAFSFGRCYVEVPGRMGLCTRRFSLECVSGARVYPDLGPMRHYRMLAEKKQLSREDAALHRLRGIGAEFADLREYTRDDDRRHINWKATARAGKLITNVYDTEKNREVVLAVDTGRWMRARMGGSTRLDRALEMAAALMQVAMLSGDRVGLALYDTGVGYYLPPGKGRAQRRLFLEALYAAQAAGKEPSFAALAALLRRKLTKRAFICLFSYLDSPAEALPVAAELEPLRRRHTLYFASLTDTGLEEMIRGEAAEAGDLYRKAAAAFRKTAELSAADALRRFGIGAHAAEPGELLTQSVRHYLSVKQLPQ